MTKKGELQSGQQIEALFAQRRQVATDAAKELSIHKGVKVRNAIEARGCQLLFLPSYSPDLSPIEEAFSKLKAALRRASARTREA